MLLELSGLSKEFGEFRLQPLDLEIRQGEFFSLLGPSGCGKTTVLRLIGGFEKPSGGTIRLGGKEITNLAPHLRNIHTVFQRYALFPHLTVFENIAFSLRLKKTAPSEIARRVNAMLELTEIVALKNRRTPELSGGQSQRVALARALVDEPSVLLLDEPLSALDPALRLKMREELRALCRKVGSTFIMVTHDQEEALQISDRMAVLKDGRCLQVGPPKAIYEDPVDTFVARFLGPANEIPADLQEGNGEQVTVQSALGVFRAKKNGIALSKEVFLVVRPEKMRILRQRSATQENLIEGEIVDSTYLGSRTEYLVQSGSLSFRVFEPELERLKKKNLNPKDRIFLSWKQEDAILLPRDIDQ